MVKSFITFDWLRLKTAAKNVKITDVDRFIYKEHIATHAVEYVYEQKDPYHFYVSIGENYAYIDFTGKALLDDYTSLIKATNITKCFDNINSIGVLQLNTQAILQDATVLKCDVTADVSFDRPLKTAMQNVVIQNNSKWSVCERGDFKIKFQNQVLTKRRRTSLVIYDKAHEMSFVKNRPFLDAVCNADEMMAYFSDKIRFELNLQSVDRIKYYFDVEDVSLANLLNAESDPIQNALDEIFDQDIFGQLRPHCSAVKEIEHLLLFCACNYDLPTVENLVRSVMPKNYSISRLMQPYKTLAATLAVSFTEPVNPIAFDELAASIAWILNNTRIFTESLQPSLNQIYTNSNNNKNFTQNNSL